MNTLSKSFIAVFIIVLCSACLNDEPLFDGQSCISDCIVFTGKVTDPNNDIPISTKLKITFTNGGLVFRRTENIGVTSSNELGEYSFSFPGENYKVDNGYFIIKAEKAGYLVTEYDGRAVIYSVDSTNFDLPFVNDILLRPAAELQVSLKIDNVDLITDFVYSINYGGPKYGYRIPDEFLVQDTFYLYDVGGDQKTEVVYSYKKENQEIKVVDSIFINAGEKGIYEIDI